MERKEGKGGDWVKNKRKQNWYITRHRRRTSLKIIILLTFI